MRIAGMLLLLISSLTAAESSYSTSNDYTATIEGCNSPSRVCNNKSMNKSTAAPRDPVLDAYIKSENLPPFLKSQMRAKAYRDNPHAIGEPQINVNDMTEIDKVWGGPDTIGQEAMLQGGREIAERAMTERESAPMVSWFVVVIVWCGVACALVFLIALIVRVAWRSRSAVVIRGACRIVRRKGLAMAQRLEAEGRD